MSYRISVDTGGTFTDVVVADPMGRLHIGKAPTTPERAYDGLSASLDDAARALGALFAWRAGADADAPCERMSEQRAAAAGHAIETV